MILNEYSSTIYVHKINMRLGETVCVMSPLKLTQ